MPFLNTNNHTVHFQFEDFKQKETIIFSNSLGTDFSMWDNVVQHLAKKINVLRYDTRGHGQSSLTPHFEKLSIADLGKDVLALLDHLQLEKVHFCGLSMGGLIGQWLGINASNRFKTITIANTAAKIGNEEGWNSRIALVKNEGFENLSKATEERWFTENFRKNSPDTVATIINKFKLNDRNGYTANCGAIRDADFRLELSQIECPILIITGDKDEVTNIEHAEFLNKNIANSKLVILEAAHLSAVEQASQFAGLVSDWVIVNGG
jgi:3-oxoadipate enol-lactonase